MTLFHRIVVILLLVCAATAQAGASILDTETIRLAKKHGTVFSMDIYNTEYTYEFGKANGIPEAVSFVMKDGVVYKHQ